MSDSSTPAKSHDESIAATTHEHLLEQTAADQLTCCECFAVFKREPGGHSYLFDPAATEAERQEAAQNV